MIYCKLSNFIFQKVFLPAGVEEKYRSIYSYGLEAVMSTFFNMTVIFILFATLNVFPEMICFLATYIPLRLYGGGAHASSHFKCLMLFTLCILGSIIASMLIAQADIYIPLSLAGVICCMFLQYRFSMDKKKNLRYKVQPLIKFAFPWTICLITSLLLFTPIEPKYTIISVLGIYVQSISLLPKKGD